MESLSQLYSLLPMIINSLLSDQNEQDFHYHQLTDKIIELCSKINKNGIPMSHSRLKKITTTDFEITLESFVVSAYLHYKERIVEQNCDNENMAYEALIKTMKTLHIKTSDPETLIKLPYCHVLKVLFNINSMNYKLAA